MDEGRPPPTQDGKEGERTSKLEEEAGKYEAHQVRESLKFAWQIFMCPLSVSTPNHLPSSCQREHSLWESESPEGWAGFLCAETHFCRGNADTKSFTYLGTTGT